MRRTYISPEFKNNKVHGSFNLQEEGNFFAGEIINITDYITISDSDIIWYQKNSNEQINLEIEKILDPISYSSNDDKKKNHILDIDQSQTQYQLERNTRWILTIDYKEILQNYIFAILKKNRTFQGLKNDMVLEKNVNVSIKKYIKNNILNKYKLLNVIFFLEHKDINNRYDNSWNNNLTSQNIFSKYEKNVGENNIQLKFNQKSSQDYNFDYYFDLIFEKI